MSLFDGQPIESKRRGTKKTKSIHQGKSGPHPEESLFDPKYGDGTRSYARSTAAKRTREATKDITERYLAGELKFPDVSFEFVICNCDQFPRAHTCHSGYDEFGHNNQEEMDLFREECHAWKDADER